MAAFGSTLTEPEQEIRRRRFSHLPLLGPIRLRAPDTQLVILEHYGARPEDTAGPPKRLYFLRELGRGQRRLVHRFTLKERKYLGPTSMDTELSLIMANQALARPGALVFDPFVGTGSLLVAATAFGARCLGADIDIRVLRGKCDVNPFTNFEQVRAPARRRFHCGMQALTRAFAVPPHTTRYCSRGCVHAAFPAHDHAGRNLV